jgi:hypothetical protein
LVQTIPVRAGAVEVLVEVTPVAGTQQTSAAARAAERAAEYAAGAFERAQAAVESIAVSTAQTIDRVTAKVGGPSQVEVEFGLKVSAKGDVIVAGSSAEASLKVKIIYGGARAPVSGSDGADGDGPES